jgi:hypothetical protein
VIVSVEGKISLRLTSSTQSTVKPPYNVFCGTSIKCTLIRGAFTLYREAFEAILICREVPLPNVIKRHRCMEVRCMEISLYLELETYSMDAPQKQSLLSLVTIRESREFRCSKQEMIQMNRTRS